MIFLDENTAIGSKHFTHELVKVIRPKLAEIFNEDRLEDVDLGLLQDMFWLDDLSADDFNFIFTVIQKAQLASVEQTTLLDAMTKDNRFNSHLAVA